MNFLRQKWKQKCSAWGPVSSVQASIFKNAERIGIDPASIALAMPMWGPGSFQEYSKNKFNPTISGAVFTANSFLMDGTDDKFYYSDNALWTPTTSMTIFVVATLLTYPVSSNEGIIAHYTGIDAAGSAYNHRSWALAMTPAGVVRLELSSNGSYQSANSINGATISAGQTFASGLVWKASARNELYVDGKKYYNVTVPATLYNAATELCIGNQYSHINNSGYKNTALNAKFHFVLLLREQDLSANAMAYLSDNPYFLLQRVAQVYYSVPGGAITIKTITDAGSGIDGIAQILNVFALSDTGSGLDGFSGLIAGLSVGDVGAGSDSVTPSVRLTVQDTGAAIDLIQQIVSGCNVTDSCVGADNIGQILAALLVADIGCGVDGISVFKELLKTVTDSVTGTDSLSQILADISISDTGAGSDFIDLLKSILKTISDTGSGTETVLVQPVSVSVQDASAALDIIGHIAVALSVSDASTIAEIISTIKTKLVNVTDAGAGYDSEPNISVSVTVSDAAVALDVIGQVINALAVYDTGSGLDRITKTDFNILPSGKVTVTFTIKTPGASFAMRTPKATFTIE